MAHSNLAKAANSLLTAAEVNKLLSEDGSGNFTISGGKTLTMPGEDILLTGTNALQLPVGTTNQRPAAVNGKIRVNSTNGLLEYYSTAKGGWVVVDYASVGPTIGEAYGGGFFAGYVSYAGNGVADYMLIVGPAAATQIQKAWDDAAQGEVGAGAQSVIDGKANTDAIIAFGTPANFPAAYFCDTTCNGVGGVSDWYLPAKNELGIAFWNLKNVVEANYQPGTHGINANAVPPSVPINTAHTATVPAQTNVIDFQVGGTEAFAANYFWSSTEAAATTAWRQYFYSGYPGAQTPTTKTNATLYVRAFRRLAI